MSCLFGGKGRVHEAGSVTSGWCGRVLENSVIGLTFAGLDLVWRCSRRAMAESERTPGRFILHKELNICSGFQHWVLVSFSENLHITPLLSHGNPQSSLGGATLVVPLLHHKGHTVRPQGLGSTPHPASPWKAVLRRTWCASCNCPP